MKRKKILIADDEASIRTLVKRFLGKYYTVLEAENGKVAVDIIKKEKPDLVLMDIMMPKMDGYSACAEIRASELARETQVVMLTSLAHQLSKELAQELGADGYITKPINLSELREAVERFLSAS